MGLGTVWLGVYPMEDRVAGVRKLLNLPEHIVPLALVPVGSPKAEKRDVSRWDEPKVSRNRWVG